MSAGETRSLLAEAERQARRLHKEECDPNELGKAVSMLARPGATVAEVVRTLRGLANDRDAHHSGRTRGYVGAVLRIVEEASRRHRDDRSQTLRFLGWTFRKLRYLRAVETSRRGG